MTYVHFCAYNHFVRKGGDMEIPRVPLRITGTIAGQAFEIEIPDITTVYAALLETEGAYWAHRREQKAQNVQEKRQARRLESDDDQRIRVLAALRDAGGAPVVTAQLSAQTGIGQEKVRAYCQALVTSGLAEEKAIGGGTPGRPIKGWAFVDPTRDAPPPAPTPRIEIPSLRDPLAQKKGDIVRWVSESGRKGMDPGEILAHVPMSTDDLKTCLEDLVGLDAIIWDSDRNRAYAK